MSPVARVLSFSAMKHKPFRKPRIRKFGDVSRLTRQQPQGETKCQGVGQTLQGNQYECF